MRGLRKKAGGPLSVSARRLTLPLVLEEGRAPRVSTSLLYLASAFVAACIVWASITKIKELTVANGQVKPVGSVQLVQHLEGGLIAEIKVSEGEIIEKGAPLVRLQPTAATSDLGQVEIRAANLSLQKERLTAQLEARPPKWGDLEDRYPNLVREQLDALQAQRGQREKELDSLTTRVELRETEVHTLSEQIASTSRQLEIQGEQLRIRESLLAEGLVAKPVYLETKRVYEETKGQVATFRGQLGTAQESLNEARIELLKLDTEYKKTLTEERSRVAAELAEVEQSISKLRDRVRRLLVRAPIKGIIQELVPKAIGEVVEPGGIIARLVPMNNELVAEVRISPEDIGHIKIGATADIKISTFDPARFGTIDGRVRKISASTFQSEEGEPYYKAVIGLGRDHVGLNGEMHQVLPGMVVNAEIITGEKSLTRYLLKPVYRSLDVAFSER